MRKPDQAFALLLLCMSRAGIGNAALTGSATLDKFSSLVVFGDSYTDAGPEFYTPEPSQGFSNATSTGGRIWPDYVRQYAGVNLYDYAVGGAVCDSYFSPSSRNGVKQSQMDYFLKDNNYTGDGELVNPANETIYAVWIGTNDLGPAAFFIDNRLNLTVLDYVDCVYAQLDRLHEIGARNFVLLNIAPLNFAPMYALPENGGTIRTSYWKNEDEYSTNVTLVSEKMRQYVALVNAVYNYRTADEVQMADRYPASSFTILDVHSLMSDIWNNPSQYLNGTVEPNVTGTISGCGSDCDDADVRDSYMWHDSLHPSEQTDRIIAEQFVDVVTGKGTWGKTWLSPS